MKKTIVATLLALGLCSCGGSQPDVQSQDEDRSSTITAEDTATPEESTKRDEPKIITTVTRAQMDGILAKGPANILGLVQTDSHLEGGKFLGFKIVSFRVSASEILGLRPGDTVTRVNGLPIETPDQYFEVFERLKKAQNVSFKILRDGKTLDLETPIEP